jgi:hypothetical protein
MANNSGNKTACNAVFRTVSETTIGFTENNAVVGSIAADSGGLLSADGIGWLTTV